MAASEGNQYAIGNDGGAPTKYKKEFAGQAYKLCLLGYTEKELAFFFEVDEKTIDNWKKNIKSFSSKVKAGKDIADANVAERFYKRATGYEYNEVTFEKVDGKENLELTTEGEIIKTDSYKKKVVTKHLPPDAGAALNWLKNRQKRKWRDKHELGVTDEDGNDVVHIFQLPDNGRNKVHQAAEGLPGEGA